MTIDQALAYIRAKLASWGQLPAQIAAQQTRAATLASVARARGALAASQTAQNAGNDLASLAALVKATTAKLVAFLADLTGTGAPNPFADVTGGSSTGPVQLPGPYRSDYATAHPELFSSGLGDGYARRLRPVAGVAPWIAIPRRPTRRPARLPLLPVLRRLPRASSELGAVPVVLGAVALALAAAMALVYKRLETQARILDGVESGLLPASVLVPGAEPESFTGQLGKSAGQLLTWGAVGLGVYLVASKAMRPAAARG